MAINMFLFIVMMLLLQESRQLKIGVPIKHIINQRVEVESVNKEFLENFSYKITYYNRTTRMLNAQFELKKDLSQEVTNVIKTYMKINNKYTHYPALDLTSDICSIIKYDLGGYSRILKENNITLKCPFRKGIYRIKNVIIQGVDLPPLIPDGQYKVEVEAFVGKEKLEKGTLYGTIVTDYTW